MLLAQVLKNVHAVAQQVVVHWGTTISTEIAADVAALISREMEHVAALNVPLTAEAKIGKSWFEAK